MVWFHCEDCGESLKKQKLRRHFSICIATKLSCIDCGNMFGQDSVHYHNQCMTEAEKYGLKEPLNGDSSKQLTDFDINAKLYNTPSWFCSLCNAKMTCEKNYFAHVYGKKHREKAKELSDKQKQQSEQPTIDKDNLKQLPDIDIYVGLSNQYPWFCSLCNTKATSQQSLLSHANGKKHRENVKGFDAKQFKQQSKHLTVDKDNSNDTQKSKVDVGLSNHHPWFCSLCNTKATSEKSFLSHTNGRKHRENVDLCDANQQQQQLDKSMVDKKYTIEYAPDGEYESKKVDFPVASGIAHGYSQGVRKRKLETFDETWNEEVLQAEEAKGGTKKKSESKKAKQQNEIVDLVYKTAEKKQTKSDSDFECDKEDIKQLLLSYSKEEIVDLVYKTAEKGSRLITAILELADCDIAQRNIFVRGFGWDTTHENLKAAFEYYGEIEECSVVMDKDTGRGKGYGFVLFKTRKGAREALRNPQKRLYNRTVVCNLASKKPSGTRKGQDMVEPVKIDLTNTANQSEVALPGLELAHRHILEKRQQTMDMLGQNMPYYGQSQLPGFDPMYGGSQMVAGLPNYCMFGSGMMMNQGSMMNHMGMAEQCFGDGKHAWYQR